jgi:hypothetical protein
MQKKQKPTRGRPKKVFISRKPQIKRDKPGRPRKWENLLTHPAFQQPVQKDTSVKDAIILIVFILSVLVFWYSLYLSRQKKHIAAEPISNDANITIQNNSTGEVGEVIATSQDTSSGEIISTGNLLSGEENPPSILEGVRESNPLISSLISSINALDLTTFKSLLAPSLRNTSTINTYFNQKRLTRFINNLTDSKITIAATSSSDTTITYTINYTLKQSQQTFTETRIVQLTNNQIASMRCDTQWCSRMPFFNPGKYNLK